LFIPIVYSVKIITFSCCEFVFIHPVFTVLENCIIEMTIFKITLRPILIFKQFLGLINISYILDTGLLLRNTRSTIIYPLLEVARTMSCVLVYLHHLYMGTLLGLLLMSLLKFWCVIIAARLSEKWIIKNDNMFLYLFKCCIDYTIEYSYY